MALTNQPTFPNNVPRQFRDAITFDLEIIPAPDDTAFIVTLTDVLYADWCECPVAEDGDVDLADAA